MELTHVFGLASIVFLLAAIYVLRSGDKDEQPVIKKKVKREAPNGRVQIYFGSQTGTAEGYAKTIADEANRRGFEAEVIDLEDFDDDHMTAPLQLFAMATYGEGEPTDNAHQFVDWLKASKDSGILDGKRYAVFGLGNRQYQHFNSMGKLTDKYLEKAGAERVLEVGLGDDDADLEADFDQWRENLWSTLGVVEESGDVQASLRVVYGSTPTKPLQSSTQFYGTKATFTVTAKRELRTPKDGGSTVHVEFSTDAQYETADNLSILPRNCREDVSMVIDALKLDASKQFSLDTDEDRVPFPSPVAVGDALAQYCDLTAFPKRGTVAALVRAAIQAGASPSDAPPSIDQKDAFSTWAKDAPTLARAVAKLKPLFASIDTTSVFATLLEKGPRLQPRAYTICSSAKADAELHVVCAIADLPHGQRGVCSAYLADLQIGDVVRGVVKPSAFRAPITKAPVVLIGPGTGIAPFRAILRERAAALKGNGASNAPWGPSRVSSAILYFGCKRRDEDHLYREEMDQWPLDAKHVAYSREQKHKVYVQDLMRKKNNAEALASAIIDGKGSVYVCGGTSMGTAVMEAVIDALEARLKDRAQAEKFVQQMHDGGMYVQELWS